MFFLALSVAAVAALDELSSSSSSPGDFNGPSLDGDESKTVTHSGSGRAFVLFIDSFRSQSAIDPALMPRLAQLRSSGVSGEVETVFDAVTAPAIRAAFTGQDHFRVLGFVQNFVRRRGTIPSVLSHLAQRGGKSALYSDMKTFLQFGDTEIEHLPSEAQSTGDAAVDQMAQARIALQRFLAGGDTLVLFHAGFVDYVAHQKGTAHPDYVAAHHAVDELIGAIDQAVPRTDAFLIIGDHGHTDTGRHAIGLDVPTYFFARGNGFTADLTLPRFYITAYRYFLSWALKLPLGKDYFGDLFPQALNGDRTTLEAFGFARPGLASPAPEGKRKAPAWSWFGLAMALGGAFSLWWFLDGPPRLAKVRWGHVLHWRAWGPVIGWGAGLGLLLALWGVGLADLRPHVHEPFYPTLHRIWAFALLVALVSLRFMSPAAIGWVIFAAPYVLAWPTVYRYGGPGALVPVWMVWVIMTTAMALRAAPDRDLAARRGLRLGRWFVPRVLLLAAAIIWLVQPYFLSDASNFEFSRFVPLSPEVAPKGAFLRSLAGAGAAYVLLYRRSLGSWGQVASGIFAAYVVADFLRVIPEGSLVHLSVTAASVALLLVVGRAGVRWRVWRVPLGTVALVAASYWVLRNGAEARLDGILFLAAIRMSLAILEELPPALRSYRAHGLFFMALGTVAVGWATLRWGVARLEWQSVYDLAGARFVEEHVALFLPLIVLKYALPLLLVRVFVEEAMAAEGGLPYPTAIARKVLGLKIVSLLAIMVGLGFRASTSGVYLEAAGELAILLAIGIAWL